MVSPMMRSLTSLRDSGMTNQEIQDGDNSLVYDTENEVILEWQKWAFPGCAPMNYVSDVG